ncbi:MAG TPA: PAS domain-containing protein [Gemmatimonadales bacterium]|nr:PAS domain-containing protein [Gemmatimonadales bacterium]
MRDLRKGKLDLLDSNSDLRKQVADLKQSAMERRRIEDSLRREGEALHALLDGSPVALCLLGANGRPVQANQPFARLLGYGSPGELVRLGGDLGIFMSDPADVSRNPPVVAFRTKQGSALPLSVLWSDGPASGPRALAVLPGASM